MYDIENREGQCIFCSGSNNRDIRLMTGLSLPTTPGILKKEIFMKELTQTEVQTVSGAGTLASSLGSLGSMVGGAMKLIGMKNSVANAAAIGNNIGMIFESVYGAVSSTVKFFFDKK